MSFARNVSIGLGARVALVAINLVTSIITARLLGPEGRGLLALAVTSAGIVFMATNMGVGTASGFFLGRRKIPLDRLAGTWLILSAVSGLAALGVALPLAPVLVPRLLPAVPLGFVVVTLLSVPAIILVYNLQGLLRAMNEIKRYYALDLVHPILFLLMIAVAFPLLPRMRLETSIAANVAAHILLGTTAVILVRRVTPLAFRWDRALVADSLTFGAQGYFANILVYFNTQFDVLLVNYFLSPASVGIYSIAVVIAARMWTVPDVLSTVLHPRVAHAGDREATIETARVVRINVMAIGLGCAAILLLGRFAIRLFYSDLFLPAVAPLFLLCPGILSMSVARILASDLIARGHPRLYLWAGLVSLASNVGLNLWLIPRIGLSGAAIASSVSYTILAFVLVVFFKRITGAGAAGLLVPTGRDVRFVIDQARRLLRPSGRESSSAT